MSKLYSVTFWTTRFAGNLQAELIRAERIVGPTGDWIRITQTQWFIWTAQDRDALLASLRALRSSSTDQLIITAVQPEAAQGDAPQWIWDWLNDKMNRQFHGRP